MYMCQSYRILPVNEMSYPSNMKHKAPQINLPYPRQNKDIIQQYFNFEFPSDTPQRSAICKLCKAKIDGVIIGSTVYSSYSSGMNSHLRKHPTQWQDYLQLLAKTIKSDNKSPFEHYQSMARRKPSSNKFEASKLFCEVNSNSALNTKYKNLAGVCYTPRDCEVVNGKISDFAKYDIAELLRHLYQFTNRNVHIFELMGTKHESAPLRANYKLSKCLVDNDENITSDIERLLCDNICFFDPELYGECEHSGDINLFAREYFQARFPGFQDEIEKYPDFQIDKSFNGDILKEVRIIEHDKLAAVQMRRMLIILLTLISCQKERIKSKIKQIIDMNTDEDNIRKPDSGIFLWGPKVTDVDASLNEDESIGYDEKIFYTHIHVNSKECPAYNDQKKSVYKEVFYDDGQAFYPCDLGGCCKGCPCIPCNSLEYREPNSFRCLDHNPDHPAMFYDKEDLALSRRKYFAPYSIKTIYERPLFDKKKCPPKIKFAKMKKKCPRCRLVLNDHRKNHHVLHDACQLCNHMHIASTTSFELTCFACLKTYEDKYRLADHMNSHDKEEPAFYCDKCETKFTRKCTLDEHMDLYHSENPEAFSCEECSTSFSKLSHFKRHVKAQHTKNEEEFDCDECGKKFNRHDNLLKHMRYAHNLKRKTLVLPGINDELENFQCSYCEKVYTQKFSLIRHMESKHSKERNYRCYICDKSFQRKDVLKVHQQNHS